MKELYVTPKMESEIIDMDVRYMDNQFSGPTDDFTKERNNHEFEDDWEV